MWCPKCKAEYREGFTVCADCGCELAPASSQEALEKPPHVTDDTSADQAILRMACRLLFRALVSNNIIHSHFFRFFLPHRM